MCASIICEVFLILELTNSSLSCSLYHNSYHLPVCLSRLVGIRRTFRTWAWTEIYLIPLEVSWYPPQRTPGRYPSVRVPIWTLETRMDFLVPEGPGGFLQSDGGAVWTAESVLKSGASPPVPAIASSFLDLDAPRSCILLSDLRILFSVFGTLGSCRALVELSYLLHSLCCLLSAEESTPPDDM